MGRVLSREEDVVGGTEFELTDTDFRFIQWFMHKHAGIYFSDRKRTMVYGRISRQLRRLGLRRFTDYKLLIEQDSEERVGFINSLTTNKTQFFREYHHFEFLENVMLKVVHRRKQPELLVGRVFYGRGAVQLCHLAILKGAFCFSRTFRLRNGS